MSLLPLLNFTFSRLTDKHLINIDFQVRGDKDADGFYWGEVGGRAGYVPCNMVSEVQVDDERVAQELLKVRKNIFINSFKHEISEYKSGIWSGWTKSFTNETEPACTGAARSGSGPLGRYLCQHARQADDCSI